MELQHLMDYDSDKILINKRSCWYNALLLVALLLASHLAQNLSQESVGRSIRESISVLGVKFVNFCIAKSVEFRYIAPLQDQGSFMSLVFWFVLARSVSSLYS